jgi:hypothetical protein
MIDTEQGAHKAYDEGGDAGLVNYLINTLVNSLSNKGDIVRLESTDVWVRIELNRDRTWPSYEGAYEIWLCDQEGGRPTYDIEYFSKGRDTHLRLGKVSTVLKILDAVSVGIRD